MHRRRNEAQREWVANFFHKQVQPLLTPIGLDPSHPFPQVAIQEFRVISQNFKAEYEQASSSIITSVTRSGTNELTGDAFITYQDSDWTSENYQGSEVGVERLETLDEYIARAGAAFERLRRIQRHQPPVVDDRHPVAEVLRLVEVVRDVARRHDDFGLLRRAARTGG